MMDPRISYADLPPDQERPLGGNALYALRAVFEVLNPLLSDPHLAAIAIHLRHQVGDAFSRARPLKPPIIADDELVYPKPPLVAQEDTQQAMLRPSQCELGCASFCRLLRGRDESFH